MTYPRSAVLDTGAENYHISLFEGLFRITLADIDRTLYNEDKLVGVDCDGGVYPLVLRIKKSHIAKAKRDVVYLYHISSFPCL